MKNWTRKQLTEYDLIDRVKEEEIREFFSSKTYDCNLRIIGVHWSALDNEKVLYVAAVGEFNDELQLFKFKVMNPSMPRVHSLEELIDSEIVKMCNYGQYSAKSTKRKMLSCYCKIEKTDGKSFNLSTSALDKDLGKFVNSLPIRASLQSKDYQRFSKVPIRDLQNL